MTAGRLLGDLVASARYYADALGSLVGLESRVWRQVRRESERRHPRSTPDATRAPEREAA